MAKRGRKPKARAVKKAKKVVKKQPAKKEDKKPKEIRIVNIVVSGSLDKNKIPLEKMAATLPNTEYNPEQFPGLVLRIREPKTSALIFNSGKIVCTGARSMEKVDEAMKKIVEAMKKIGIEIKKKPEYQVQNMVASGSINMNLNLNTLAIKLENTEYEPEQFPGLVYKLRGTKATFLLFTNGEIVCTGTKSEAEVHEAVKKLVEVLKNVTKKK
jgi:transcription initiation factor TFIID TATA-box-binding protein